MVFTDQPAIVHPAKMATWTLTRDTMVYSTYCVAVMILIFNVVKTAHTFCYTHIPKGGW